MSERHDINPMFPIGDGESVDDWSNRLITEGGKRGVYRQCSLGWHLECSLRDEHGPDCLCQCVCHVKPREFDFDPFSERNWSPETVKEVTDYAGDVWTLIPGSKWQRPSGIGLTVDWLTLLRRFGPVTEVVEGGEDG